MEKDVVKIIGQDNETIGYIFTDFFGNRKVFDADRNLRGCYNKEDNLTIDAHHNIVGVGDGSYYLLKFI